MYRVFMNAIDIIGTVAIVACYAPQIMTLYKKKRVEGIDLSFWVILNIGLIALFIKAIDIYMRTGDSSMLILQTFNLGLALVVMFQVIYYKRRNRNAGKERRPIT